MTIKDVARLAGVAPSTVSRVINSKGENCAGPEVRKKVWDAVRQLGYIPNQQAKRLKEGAGAERQSGTIHILFARVKSPEDDSFFYQLSTYVQAECLRQGLKVGLLLANHEAKKLAAEGFAVGKSDGLVILGRAEENLDDFIGLFRRRVVYVTLNQMETKADHIMCDGVQATEKALQYLYDKGHRHLAYVGEYSNEIRYHTFRRFISEKMMAYSRESIINTPMTVDGGMEAAKKLVACANLPTAVFCANDITAIGLLKGLRRLGITVPQDISVISIDNIAEAGDTTPGLTTVKIPLDELGTFAVKTLVDRLNKGHTIYLSVFMPTQLVVRDSVLPCKKNMMPGY